MNPWSKISDNAPYVAMVMLTNLKQNRFNDLVIETKNETSIELQLFIMKMKTTQLNFVDCAINVQNTLHEQTVC